MSVTEGKRHQTWPLYLGLALIFLGLGLLLYFHPESLFYKILIGGVTEVGFAFLIAWVVAIIIEQSARREYDKYTQEKAVLISQNVFGYLYSVSFPRSAFTAMEKHVFEAPVIKTKQLLSYELPDHEVAPGWLKMKCEFDYTLKNLSDKAVRHNVRFHVSKVCGLNEPAVPGIGLQTLVIGDDVIPAERFSEINEAEPDEVGQERFVVERLIGAGEELRVRVTFSQIKRTMDNDLWQSNSVCENLEVKLRYNPEIHQVFAEPVHPVKKFAFDAGPCNGDQCRTVRIDTALLPSNGIFMWWNPVPVPSVAHTPEDPPEPPQK